MFAFTYLCNHYCLLQSIINTPSLRAYILQFSGSDFSENLWEFLQETRMPPQSKRKKKAMQFPGEAQSYTAGNSNKPRGIFCHLWSPADPTDWVLSFLPVNGKHKPKHVALLHPYPPGNLPSPHKELCSSSTPTDN